MDGRKKFKTQYEMLSVSRFLTVLDCFAMEQPVWGIRELAQRLGTSPSNVQRIIATMEQYSWLQQCPDTKKYRVGTHFLHIMGCLLSNAPISRVAEPVMRELAAEYGETVYLCIHHRNRLIFSYRIEVPHELGFLVDARKEYSLYIGAAGKAILAFMPGEQIECILDSAEFQVERSSRAVDKKALIKELGLIKERGYATSFGERIPGVVGVAAPIFDNCGRIVGCLDIGVPEQRYSDEKGLLLSKAVRQKADIISYALGAQVKGQSQHSLQTGADRRISWSDRE